VNRTPQRPSVDERVGTHATAIHCPAFASRHVRFPGTAAGGAVSSVQDTGGSGSHHLGQITFSSNTVQ